MSERRDAAHAPRDDPDGEPDGEPDDEREDMLDERDWCGEHTGEDRGAVGWSLSMRAYALSESSQS